MILNSRKALGLLAIIYAGGLILNRVISPEPYEPPRSPHLLQNPEQGVFVYPLEHLGLPEMLEAGMGAQPCFSKATGEGAPEIVCLGPFEVLSVHREAEASGGWWAALRVPREEAPELHSLLTDEKRFLLVTAAPVATGD